MRIVLILLVVAAGFALTQVPRRWPWMRRHNVVRRASGGAVAVAVVGALVALGVYNPPAKGLAFPDQSLQFEGVVVLGDEKSRPDPSLPTGKLGRALDERPATTTDLAGNIRRPLYSQCATTSHSAQVAIAGLVERRRVTLYAEVTDQDGPVGPGTYPEYPVGTEPPEPFVTATLYIDDPKVAGGVRRLVSRRVVSTHLPLASTPGPADEGFFAIGDDQQSGTVDLAFGPDDGSDLVTLRVVGIWLCG